LEFADASALVTKIIIVLTLVFVHALGVVCARVRVRIDGTNGTYGSNGWRCTRAREGARCPVFFEILRIE